MSNFKCQNCQKQVLNTDFMGVGHRNHCPYCLWSLHLDLEKAGDRKSLCRGLMEPIGLTFKKVKPDKYGKEKTGELMLAHQCQKCGKISINRIAGDDDPEMILAVFEKSQKSKKRLKETDIVLLTKKDKEEIKNQLFGKFNVSQFKNCYNKNS